MTIPGRRFAAPPNQPSDSQPAAKQDDACERGQRKADGKRRKVPDGGVAQDARGDKRRNDGDEVDTAHRNSDDDLPLVSSL